MKKFFKWPKEIYVFLLAEFIVSLEFLGVVLLIFFKDWGGLSQTEVQILQSWFIFWTFVLEIPTGIFADVRGKKLSVILGFVLLVIGFLTYTVKADFVIFLFAEFLLALGIALQSGAQEGWIFDRVKSLKVEKDYRKITIVSSNVKMLGMIVAAVIFPISVAHWDVENIVRFSIVPITLSMLLLLVFVKKDKKNGFEITSYKKVAQEGFKIVKNNTKLRSIAMYTMILGATSYFVIWLYQEALLNLNVGKEQFGFYRIILLLSQIVFVWMMGKLIEKKGTRKAMFAIGLAVSAGFLIAGLAQNILGVIAVLILSGGIGLQVRQVFSKEINEEIDDIQRSTVLSFIGMVRRSMLIFLNPVVGILVDTRGVFLTFIFLGLFSLFAIFKRKKCI